MKVLRCHVGHTMIFHRPLPSAVLLRKLTNYLPTNNGLFTRNTVQKIFCSCVIETTSLCENGRSLPWAVREWFKIIMKNKLGHRMIELGYCKISWFVVTVSQINSVEGWSRWLICSRLTNNDILLNLVRWLLIVCSAFTPTDYSSDRLSQWLKRENGQCKTGSF